MFTICEYTASLQNPDKHRYWYQESGIASTNTLLWVKNFEFRNGERLKELKSIVEMWILNPILMRYQMWMKTYGKLEEIWSLLQNSKEHMFQCFVEGRNNEWWCYIFNSEKFKCWRGSYHGSFWQLTVKYKRGKLEEGIFLHKKDTTYLFQNQQRLVWSIH